MTNDNEAREKALPERDATPDEAFELGRIAGYDEAVREVAAQEAATEVEWEYRRVRPDGRPVLGPTFSAPPELDEGWSMQRSPAHVWQEAK